MTYSFTPFMDMSSDHTGFWIIVVVMLLLAYTFHEEIQRSPTGWQVVAAMVALAPLAFVGYISFANPNYEPPTNVPVTAAFAGYVPVSGRSPTVYGSFTLENGSTVLIEVGDVIAIPPYVTLYRYR